MSEELQCNKYGGRTCGCAVGPCAVERRRATPPSPSTARVQPGPGARVNSNLVLSEEAPSTAIEVGERQAFEAWVRQRGGSCMKGFAGDYIESMTRLWWECWQARAALASKPVAREVENWQFVPKEPTEAMMHAAEDVPAPRPYGAVYRAMLSAAPKLPVDASTPAPAGAAKTQPSGKALHSVLCGAGWDSKLPCTCGADVDVEAERKRFEAEANSARFFPAEIDFALTKSPSGRDQYANTHLQSRWEGWLAARRTQEGAKDAERYRWLSRGPWGHHTHPEIKEHLFIHVNPTALDAAIDAAIAATQTKEQP